MLHLKLTQTKCSLLDWLKNTFLTNRQVGLLLIGLNHRQYNFLLSMVKQTTGTFGKFMQNVICRFAIFNIRRENGRIIVKSFQIIKIDGNTLSELS